MPKASWTFETASRSLTLTVRAQAVAPSSSKRFAFPLCDRLETILEDRSVDAVLILTPPNTHLDLVSRFAAAGKHILLEKPLEISSARAEELVERASRVKLGVVLQHRFRPAVEELRRNVAKLGELVSASAAIPVWRPQSYYDQPGRGTRARDGGGVLLTQAIHTLDLLLSFAGEPAEVRSFCSTTAVHRMETEDLVCAAVRWKSGALGVVQATTCAYPGFAERIELVGTRGSALLEGTSLQMRMHNGEETESQDRGRRRRDRGRSDGLSARLAPRGAGGLPGCSRKRPPAPRERRRGVESAPVYRCTPRLKPITLPRQAWIGSPFEVLTILSSSSVGTCSFFSPPQMPTQQVDDPAL